MLFLERLRAAAGMQKCLSPIQEQGFCPVLLQEKESVPHITWGMWVELLPAQVHLGEAQTLRKICI